MRSTWGSIHLVGLLLLSFVRTSPALAGDDLSPAQIAEARATFWAFKPITDHAPPTLADAPANLTAIDRFIRARLDAAGLAPAPPADRATLVRRVYFDLIGLPPTPQQIDAFVSDNAPDAFERLVDSLLASPRFAERWGRHWLDIARFAESSGGGRSLMFPDAWRYRDYVIASVHADKPLDRFIVEQIAGDLLPDDDASPDERTDRLTALGFLALGAHNYEQQDKTQLRMDVIDEQIATVGRAFLGMTLDCARCHDHKFDPVPASDYYALAGIFGSTVTMRHANVSKWVTAALPEPPAAAAAREAHAAKLAALDRRIKQAEQRLRSLEPPNAPARAAVARGSIDPSKLPGIVVDDADAMIVGDWTPSTSIPRYVGRGYIHDNRQGKGDKSVTFTADLPAAGDYEVRLAYTPSPSRDAAVVVEISGAEGVAPVKLDQRPVPPIDSLFVSLGRFRFAAGPATVAIRTAGTEGYVIADAVQFLPLDAEPAVADATDAPDAADSNHAARRAAARAELTADLDRLRADRKRLDADAPPPPPTVMAVADTEKPADGPMHIRGLAHQIGPIVPRGFLTAASRPGPDGSVSPPRIADGQSGRLELARWIASPNNPLTARVLANRIWQKLLGHGIVRTVDNFGTTGEQPTHPELLDHLASRLVADGWSLKRTVRRIVLSRTYQQSSTPAAAALAADPGNRLLASAHRRRLDAESMRDAMLAVAGKLDLAAGGRTIVKLSEYDMGYRHDPAFARRSVYLPALRGAVSTEFDVFDAATPNVPVGCRTVSILPTQALFMMNSPDAIGRARDAARCLLADDVVDDTARLTLAFRRTLGRAPTDAERRLAADLLRPLDAADADPAAARLDRWSLLQQALFASVDFRFID